MLPELFLKRMEEMLGEEYGDFLESMEQDRCQGLRLNPLKKILKGENAAALLKPDREGKCRLPFRLSGVPWAENGYYYEKEDQPGKHPYHAAGVYYIQEPSAMAPVSMLGVCPGERILDLCAAPGGKSTQIGAAMQGRGILVSNEIHPARAKILSENIERLGIRNACVTNETPERLAEYFAGYFDRILVDAPCSGEGMFRKNEEACREWSPENVMLCARRQDEILNHAARMLCPGGRLVYSTCTFSPEEDEGSVERFVKGHPEFRLMEMKRLWPHQVRGEGHFAAVLEKEGEKEIREPGYTDKKDRDIEALKEEWGSFWKWEKEEWITESKYIRFGDNVYLAPGELPDVKGLRILRPGLHIGTVKKNRFEPSHALALAISPSHAVHVWTLDSDGSEVRAYLNGQTFTAEGENGWYLVCVDGFGLGWGKLTGSIMKNHYPKGLRINL